MWVGLACAAGSRHWSVLPGRGCGAVDALGVRFFRQVERRCTDELLASLASPTGRLARLRVAKALLEAEAAARQQRYETRVAELAAAARARGKQPKARIKPRRRDEAPDPKRVANVTDPDSRLVRTRKGSLQGYNAQAVTTCEQVIVAAELTQQAADLQQLRPMLEATAATLAAPGIADRPRTLLADAGYWTIANLTEIEGAPELLIPPARHGRQGKPRKDGRPSESRSDGLRTAMTAKLQSDQGKARYAKRKQTVEPVFGQVKDARGARHPATRHAGHHLSRERARPGRQRRLPARHPREGFPGSAQPLPLGPGRGRTRLRPGRTGRGPGRSRGHLGAVAWPTGRLPPPPAGSRGGLVELAGQGGRCLRGGA